MHESFQARGPFERYRKRRRTVTATATATAPATATATVTATAKRLPACLERPGLPILNPQLLRMPGYHCNIYTTCINYTTSR